MAGTSWLGTAVGTCLRASGDVAQRLDVDAAGVARREDIRSDNLVDTGQTDLLVVLDGHEVEQRGSRRRHSVDQDSPPGRSPLLPGSVVLHRRVLDVE